MSVGWIGAGSSVAAAPAELISVVPGGTAALASDEFFPSVSGDGNIVLFESQAFSSTFTETLSVRNRPAQTTTPVPQPVLPFAETLSLMAGGKLSRDGCHVVFWGQWFFDFPAGEWDIYSWDRCTAGSIPIPIASDVLNDDDTPGSLAVSADGRYVAYTAMPSFTSFTPHIARIDTSTLTENVLTVPFVSTQTLDISDDGAFVAIAGRRNVAGALSDQVLGWTAPCVATCTTEVVSQTDAGQAVTGFSNQPSVSADGRYVAFVSDASEFVGFPPGTPSQVYVRDRVAKITRLVADTPGQPMIPTGIGVGEPDISPDGSQIALSEQDRFENSEVWVARSTSGLFSTAIFDLVSFGVSGAPVSGARTNHRCRRMVATWRFHREAATSCRVDRCHQRATTGGYATDLSPSTSRRR